MTAPSIRSGIATTAFSSASTTWSVTMPSTVESTDRLFVILCPISGGASPTGSASGWTSQDVAAMSSGNGCAQTMEKDSVSGSEDGTSVNFTISASSKGVAIAFAVDGAHASSIAFAGTPADSSGSANPDSPSLTSGFGAVDTLWISIFAARDDDATVSSWPSSYSHAQSSAVSGGGTNAGGEGGLAARQLSAATENPGSYTLSEGEEWVAQTIAIPYGTLYGAAALSATTTISASGTKHAYGAADLSTALTVAASGRKQGTATVTATIEVSATGHGRTRGCVFVTEGEQSLLDGTWNTQTASTCRLFVDDPSKGISSTARNALTEADFTEASYTGYTGAALTSGNWTVTPGEPTDATHTQVSWTASGAPGSPVDIDGYYVTRDSDGALIYFDVFTDGPVTVEDDAAVVQFQPSFTITGSS